MIERAKKLTCRKLDKRSFPMNEHFEFVIKTKNGAKFYSLFEFCHTNLGSTYFRKLWLHSQFHKNLGSVVDNNEKWTWFMDESTEDYRIYLKSEKEASLVLMYHG